MELTVLAKAILVGFGVLGPAIGIGMIFSKGLEGISRNPEVSGKLVAFMFAGAAMVEVFGLAALGYFFII